MGLGGGAKKAPFWLETAVNNLAFQRANAALVDTMGI